MTNEEKVTQILDKHYGYHVNQGSDMWYTGNYQDRFAHLIEMAEWKDEQYAKALAPILIELDELKQQVKSLLP